MTEEMDCEKVAYFLDGITSLSFSCVGLVINACAIVMLFRTKNRRTSIFVPLMISLVTYDLFYVFLFGAMYSLPILSREYNDNIFARLVPFLMPVTQMSISGSIYTTVALTVERYISVVTPFYRQKHNLKPWMFLAPVASFVVLYSLPRFFELETEYIPQQTCQNLVTEMVVTTAAANEDGPTEAPAVVAAASAPVSTNNDDETTDSSRYAWLLYGAPETQNVSSTGTTGLDKNEPVELNNNNSVSLGNVSRCNTTIIPHLKVNDFRFNPYYVSIYVNWMNLIINIILPLAVLVGMNIRIYRTMQGHWKQQQQQGSSDASSPMCRGRHPLHHPFGKRSGASFRRASPWGLKTRLTVRKFRRCHRRTSIEMRDVVAGNPDAGSLHGGVRRNSFGPVDDDEVDEDEGNRQSVLRRFFSQRRSRNCGGGRDASRDRCQRRRQCHHCPSASSSCVGFSVRRTGVNEREAKKRDAKYTRASVVMVISFVVCNTPRFVPNVMELFIDAAKFPKWACILVPVNHLLTILNSSFNFLIYWSFCGRSGRRKNEHASACDNNRNGRGQSPMRETNSVVLDRRTGGPHQGHLTSDNTLNKTELSVQATVELRPSSSSRTARLGSGSRAPFSTKSDKSGDDVKGLSTEIRQPS